QRVPAQCALAKMDCNRRDLRRLEQRRVRLTGTVACGDLMDIHPMYIAPHLMHKTEVTPMQQPPSLFTEAFSHWQLAGETLPLGLSYKRRISDRSGLRDREGNFTDAR